MGLVIEPDLEKLVEAAPVHAWGPDHYREWTRPNLVWRIIFLQNAGRDAFLRMTEWRRCAGVLFVFGVIVGMLLQNWRAAFP